MKKKLGFSLLMILAVAISMSAQDGQRRQGQGGGQGQGARGGNSAQRYEQLKKDLKLEDKQVDSLKVIDNQFRDEMQKLRENNQGGGEGGFDREAFQKLNDKRNARVKKILTEEQYKKYLEQQTRRPAGGGPGGGGRPPQQQGG